MKKLKGTTIQRKLLIPLPPMPLLLTVFPKIEDYIS